MKEKKFILPLMVVLGLLFSMSFVMAAVTFITPSTTGDTVNATYLFSINTTLNATNVSWATSTEGIFGSTINISADQIEFNLSFATTGLTETEDTTLTVNATNETDSESGTLVINVDNTDPVCAFSVDKDIVEYLDAIGIETTQSSTDTTDLTYAWILYRSDNTQSTTSTDSAPTFEEGDFDQIDEFILSLIVTDEVSKSTACTNQTIMVKGTDGDDVIGGIIPPTLGIFEEHKMLVLGGGMFLLIAIVTIIILMINKTKKGGR